MKKTIAKLIATGAVLSVALVPMVAQAVSYYPGYSCYYRDISGSCQNYQTSNPYFLGNTRSLSPYGNRRSLHSFNAYEVQPSQWDNRYNNRYNYDLYRFEEDDDDNDYLDDDDDFFDHYNNTKQPSGWKYYYDEDDDMVRPYYLENDDDYHYNRYYDYNNRDSYFEYEHTRVYIK